MKNKNPTKVIFKTCPKLVERTFNALGTQAALLTLKGIGTTMERYREAVTTYHMSHVEMATTATLGNSVNNSRVWFCTNSTGTNVGQLCQSGSIITETHSLKSNLGRVLAQIWHKSASLFLLLLWHKVAEEELLPPLQLEFGPNAFLPECCHSQHMRSLGARKLHLEKKGLTHLKP